MRDTTKFTGFTCGQVVHGSEGFLGVVRYEDGEAMELYVPKAGTKHSRLYRELKRGDARNVERRIQL